MRPSRALLLAAASTLLGALVVAALLLSRPDDHPAGPTVRVRIIDAAGAPVPGARVLSRFGPGRYRAGDAGEVVVDGLVLRAGEAPSPAAIAAALEVVAPRHGPSPGIEPSIERDGDDWTARYVMAPCGLLAVRIEPTPREGVRATVDRGMRPGLVVPTGMGDVVRPGQPGAWRVYEGAGRIEIWLTGFAGTATEVRFVEAPAPGTSRDVVFAVKDARPIRGRIAPPERDVPDLLGRVLVTALLDEPRGGEVPMPPVEVAPDGRFSVPYAGTGRYRLEPELAFVTAAPLVADGGTDVAFPATAARPWLVLEAPGSELGTAKAVVQVRGVDDAADPEGEDLVVPGAFRRGEDGLLVGLRQDGRLRVSLVTENGLAEAVTDVEGPGPHAIALTLRTRPVGRIVLGLAGGAEAPAAQAFLLEPVSRKATVFPSLGASATFEDVPAGAWRARIRWRDPNLATVFLAGRLDVGATAEATAVPAAGGRVAVTLAPGIAAGRVPGRLRWAAGATPYGDVAGTVRLLPIAGEAGAVTEDGLLPGRYEATVLVPTEDGPDEAYALSFEVAPGETTDARARARVDDR